MKVSAVLGYRNRYFAPSRARHPCAGASGELTRPPKAIRLDNGHKFIAESLIIWCAEWAVHLWHIQPGMPNQNALIERYTRTYRTEMLNVYVFELLGQVCEISVEGL